MKKMTLNFVGDVSIASYDTYLDGKSLTSVIAKSVLDEGAKELRGLAKLTVTVEPLEGAGLSVEVE